MSEFAEYRAWKNWDEGTFGDCNSAAARYFAVEFAMAKIEIDAKLSILEIGFGNGSLASWALARGWHYVGIEIDPELVTRARAAGFEVYGAETSVDTITAGENFDLIVAFDVIEHLMMAEIIALFQSIRRRLKPTGRFIARFPSGDSPFSSAIQNGDMTHRSKIGSGIIQQLCIMTDLLPLQVRAPAFPIRGLGIKRAIRRAAVRAARAFVGKFLRLMYFDNQQRVADPNMLVVLGLASKKISEQGP